MPPEGVDPMEAALGRDSETWQPENEGDQVWGRVIGLTTGEGNYGEYPVVTVLTNDEREVRINGFTTVLRNRIMESDVEIGDHFGVRYLGRKMSSGGSEYKSFKVVLLGSDMGPKRSTGRRPAPPADDYPEGGVADPGQPPPLFRGFGSTPVDANEEPF
jgi:hypothetical protein